MQAIGDLVYEALKAVAIWLWNWWIEEPQRWLAFIVGFLPESWVVEYGDPALDMLVIANHYMPVEEAFGLGFHFINGWIAIITVKLIWKHFPVVGA